MFISSYLVEPSPNDCAYYTVINHDTCNANITPLFPIQANHLYLIAVSPKIEVKSKSFGTSKISSKKSKKDRSFATYGNRSFERKSFERNIYIYTSEIYYENNEIKFNSLKLLNSITIPSVNTIHTPRLNINNGSKSTYFIEFTQFAPNDPYFNQNTHEYIKEFIKTHDEISGDYFDKINSLSETIKLIKSDSKKKSKPIKSESKKKSKMKTNISIPNLEINYDFVLYSSFITIYDMIIPLVGDRYAKPISTAPLLKLECQEYYGAYECKRSIFGLERNSSELFYRKLLEMIVFEKPELKSNSNLKSKLGMLNDLGTKGSHEFCKNLGGKADLGPSDLEEFNLDLESDDSEFCSGINCNSKSEKHVDVDASKNKIDFEISDSDCELSELNDMNDITSRELAETISDAIKHEKVSKIIKSYIENQLTYVECNEIESVFKIYKKRKGPPIWKNLSTDITKILKSNTSQLNLSYDIYQEISNIITSNTDDLISESLFEIVIAHLMSRINKIEKCKFLQNSQEPSVLNLEVPNDLDNENEENQSYCLSLKKNEFIDNNILLKILHRTSLNSDEIKYLRDNNIEYEYDEESHNYWLAPISENSDLEDLGAL